MIILQSLPSPGEGYSKNPWCSGAAAKRPISPCHAQEDAFSDFLESTCLPVTPLHRATDRLLHPVAFSNVTLGSGRRLYRCSGQKFHARVNEYLEQDPSI